MKNIFLNSNSTYNSFNTTDIAYVEVEQLFMEDYYVKLFIQNKLSISGHQPKIIYTSGATESLVTCLNWIKSVSPTKTILGTKFDHSCVRDNCENLDLNYEQVSCENLDLEYKQVEFDSYTPNSEHSLTNVRDNKKYNASTIVLTIVNPESGEILDYELEYINQFDFVIFDITQAIGKVELDLSQVETDYGIYFSLHKIGGHKNCGVLIINDKNNKFKPLIAGKQQEGLRGGTYDLENYLTIPELWNNYSKLYDEHEYRKLWNRFYDKLKDYVIVPTHHHLYNTMMLEFKNVNCILSKIGVLNEHKIYVNAETSCLTQKNKNRIRLSWTDCKTINDNFELIVKLLLN